MICTACRCPAALSKSGLCSACRAIAHRPSGSQRRRGAYAQRWLAQEYAGLRSARNFTPEQAVLRSEMIFRELRAVLPIRAILLWGLDNPYMFKHARRTMVSDVLRSFADLRRKPVQSVRPNSTRKAVAA